MAHTPLTPELVDKLLDKLGNDDKFREEFRHDPKAAMIRLGAPPDFVAGGCLRPARLAPKEEIRHTRAVLRDVLLADDGQEIQCLEARVKR